MHRPIPMLLALLITAGTLASPAGAQGMSGMPHAKMFTFGVGGGVAVPVSNAGDALKNGFNGLAYARAQLPGMPVSVGVNVAFQRFDLKDATVQTPGLPSVAGPTGTADMLAGLGDVKLDLTQGAVHPYVIVGLGAYNLKTDAGGSSSSDSHSDTQFGINGGAGLSIRFGAIRGYVQGRVDNVYTSNGGVVDTKSIQVVPVSAGIEF